MQQGRETAVCATATSSMVPVAGIGFHMPDESQAPPPRNQSQGTAAVQPTYCATVGG